MNNRVELLRREISAQNTDAVLINSPQNKFYFSGFDGDDESGVLIITQNTEIIVTDFRYTTQAKGESNFEVVEYKKSIHDTINEIIADSNIKHLGIEEEYITYSEYKKLKEKTGCNLLSVDSAIKKIRSIKDDKEIGDIKTAVQISEKAYEKILSIIKPGITEKDIALEFEYIVKKNGAQGLSFETIVASGKNGAQPHAKVTNKCLEQGDLVVMDFGCKVNGYCSDMTRTFCIGKTNEIQKEIYDIVLKAQLEALTSIKCGQKCADVDKLARNYIISFGYGKYFGHALGHGVGIDTHESPVLSSRSETILEKNMVVTVEPGIYIPEIGGVRIEDMVIIKDDGVYNLMKTPKELIVI